MAVRVAGKAIAILALSLGWSSAAMAEAPAGAAAAAAVGAVGRINNSVGGHCTGVLVAPDIAVTAAHCLFNKRTKRWLRPEAIHFLLGYDRGTYAFHGIATGYRFGDGYDPVRPFQTIGNDWALLRLGEAAPASAAPMRAGPPRPDRSERFVAAGFARARPYVLTLSPACEASATTREALVSTGCEAPNGFSGGPLIRVSDGTLAGIQVAASRRSAQPMSLAVPAAAWTPALDALLADAGG